MNSIRKIVIRLMVWLAVAVVAVVSLDVFYSTAVRIATGTHWCMTLDMDLTNISDALGLNSGMVQRSWDQPGVPMKCALALFYKIAGWTGNLRESSFNTFFADPHPVLLLPKLFYLLRIQSLILGTGFIIFSTWIVWTMTRNALLTTLAIVCLTSSTSLLVESVLSRPEIWSTFFGAAMVPFMCWKLLHSRTFGEYRQNLLLAGLVYGLCLQSKVLGMPYLLAILACCFGCRLLPEGLISRSQWEDEWNRSVPLKNDWIQWIMAQTWLWWVGLVIPLFLIKVKYRLSSAVLYYSMYLILYGAHRLTRKSSRRWVSGWIVRDIVVIICGCLASLLLTALVNLFFGLNLRNLAIFVTVAAKQLLSPFSYGEYCSWENISEFSKFLVTERYILLCSAVVSIMVFFCRGDVREKFLVGVLLSLSPLMILVCSFRYYKLDYDMFSELPLILSLMLGLKILLAANLDNRKWLSREWRMPALVLMVLASFVIHRHQNYEVLKNRFVCLKNEGSGLNEIRAVAPGIIDGDFDYAFVDALHKKYPDRGDFLKDLDIAMDQWPYVHR